MTRQPTRFKDMLQGKPIGHPLHPALVHLPISLWLASLLCDLWTVPFGNNHAVRSAFYTLVLGLLAAIVAAVPGIADYSDIRRDHPGRNPAFWHMVLNVVAIVLYAMNAILRRDELDAIATPLAPLLLSLLAFGIIALSGYLGGVMVYGDGIGVGRHRRRTPTPERTLTATEAEGSDGFYTVAGESSLEEGATLRTELAGRGIALARLDGEIHAFQDFCTHRFGPLSEGQLRDGQVECPWHRSCFDLRTGQVTSGPAKVPLISYEVRVQDGQIQVRLPRE